LYVIPLRAEIVVVPLMFTVPPSAVRDEPVRRPRREFPTVTVTLAPSVDVTRNGHIADINAGAKFTEATTSFPVKVALDPPDSNNPT